jgi:hypothetical protein
VSEYRLNTCRLCGKSELGRYSTNLVKYGVRHYVHAECGLKKWGAAFLDKIPQYEIGHLPYRAVKAAGLMAEVERRLRAEKP